MCSSDLPRIQTSLSRDRHRPMQAPIPPHVVRARFGEDSINSISGDGSFGFKGKRYTKEGFLYCHMDEVDLCRPADDIPTQKELHTFKECSLMNEKTLSRTTSRLEQMKIKTGCRVDKGRNCLYMKLCDLILLSMILQLE